MLKLKAGSHEERVCWVLRGLFVGEKGSILTGCSSGA